MNCNQDKDIFLSQLISGILLFKSEISNLELTNIMSLVFDELKYDIIEEDCIYDNIYKYLIYTNEGIKLNYCYNYDTIVMVNNRKMKLATYLKKNTTKEIIDLLGDRVYAKQVEKSGMFFGRENLLVKKKKKVLKHEAI